MVLKTYRAMTPHANGWLEVSYNSDLEVMQRQKASWASYPILADAVPKQEARNNQTLYASVIWKMIKQGSRVVILRMPVDGPNRSAEDAALSAAYHLDFIKQDPRILYIDANIHPALSRFRPIDNSHLDAADARKFSRELATIVHKWLATSGDGCRNNIVQAH